ncbi:hypothetical protein [Nonomuraea sp. SYSU D8015]|uniref:hypothetical protein n=1 Tax=Nonomuraea sp. SYSU D8015 TaxID=2593644 RepID=UPI00166101A1|nr:hypothetical protein [Nonomuraea sp. SYSU D8015]
MNAVTEEIITHAAAEAGIALNGQAARVAELVESRLPDTDDGYTRDDISYELDAALPEVGIEFTTDEVWEMAAVVCNWI